MLGFTPLAALPLAANALVITSVGTSAGVAAVSGVGVGIHPMVGSAAGIATVSGVAAFALVYPMVGTSAGRATVLAGGQRIMMMVGTAAGYATTQGYRYGFTKQAAPSALTLNNSPPGSFAFVRDPTPDPF